MPARRTDPDELLRSLIEERSHHAIIVLDAEGAILSWNSGAQRLTGYTAADVIDRSVAMLYPPAELEQGEPDHSLSIASAAGSHHVDGWRMAKNGATFWVQETTTALRDRDGRLVGFGKTLVDDSERKRAIDTLRDDEERFRLMVEGVDDQALITLTPTGFIASWNTGATSLLAYRPDQIIGQHFSRLYRAEDLLTGTPEEQLEEADSMGRLEAEGWLVRKDGIPFWASQVITPLQSPDGTLHGYGLVVRDLTNRRRAEDALRSVLRRERETAQRRRELDAMRDDLETLVIRDLRTPLQVLSSVAGTLLTKWGDFGEAQTRALLERAEISATNLTELVDDVLRRARLESGELGFEPGPLDVPELLARLAADQPPGVADEHLSVQVEAGLPLAYGDEHRTWQVLANLLSNARRFSPPGETIVLGACALEQHVRIFVRDRGPGVAPEARRRIFERFTRLHHDDGTGLGLFIARTMVEAQGGRIGVESIPGSGSEFWFTLPRHDGRELLDAP